MRFSLWAVATLTVLGWAAPGLCASPVPATANAVAAAPPPKAPGPDISGADAAAKHAKRTACLKEAKEKKLAGAARDAYVKDCIAR